MGMHYSLIRSCPICSNPISYVANRDRQKNPLQKLRVGVYFCANCDMEIRLIKVENINGN